MKRLALPTLLLAAGALLASGCVYKMNIQQGNYLVAESVSQLKEGMTRSQVRFLLGTPMVIVYKESPINWHLLGRLIQVDNYGLVNLVAGREVVTELMQNTLNGEQLARELLALLEPARNQTIRNELRAVSAKLGEQGASHRAAESILKFLGPSDGVGYAD
mgnify:CR=1 FL=1